MSEPQVLLNIGGAALHEHRFLPDPDTRGGRCSCKITRFGSTSDILEHNPSAEITRKVYSRKMIWSKDREAL
jgi:hypothetical protein